MSEKFFTADTHFSHANIIRYCKRPFQSAEEMDNTIIANINNRVNTNDTLYHLGDFSFSNQITACREKINCKNVYLIRGNHDKGSIKAYKKNFVKFVDIFNIKINDIKIVLCHYSMRTWAASHHGSLHLFAHSHGTLDNVYTGNSIDVGVDNWNFQVCTLQEITDRIKEKQNGIMHLTKHESCI